MLAAAQFVILETMVKGYTTLDLKVSYIFVTVRQRETLKKGLRLKR